jgi:hypothetical protein
MNHQDMGIFQTLTRVEAQKNQGQPEKEMSLGERWLDGILAEAAGIDRHPWQVTSNG